MATHDLPRSTDVSVTSVTSPTPLASPAPSASPASAPGAAPPPAAPAGRRSARRIAVPRLAPSDLRGLARLGIDGIGGLTGVVESMHAAIARPALPLGPPAPARTRGLTGLVYGAVRGSTRAVGAALDVLLAGAEAALPSDAPGAPSARREALLAAVNGVWGDHLAASGNPLAIPTRLRVDGRGVDPSRGPAIGDGRRVVVLMHGLCMNDLQWRRRGHDHGEMLARELGWTPLYLHYDSGRPVADVGRETSALLETLVARWPLPIERLAIVGHSMGGLVARAACESARIDEARWLGALSTLVFLGTPHHGAPLERGGHLVERLLGASPYAAPIARLARTRSAGIGDLRHGRVSVHDVPGGPRVAVPLPAGVAVHAVAATTATAANAARAAGTADTGNAGNAPDAAKAASAATNALRGRLHERLVGDGLVPVASAFGDHPDPAFALGIPDADRLLVGSANHWDLLDRPEVSAALVGWLDRSAKRRRRRLTPPARAAAA